MAVDSDSKKIIILGSIAIILLIVVLFIVFTQLFSNPAPANEQYANFPDSGLRDEQAPVKEVLVPVVAPEEPGVVFDPVEETGPETVVTAPYSDWRDEIVSVSSNEGEAGGTYTPPATTDSSLQTKDSQAADDLIIEYQQNNSPLPYSDVDEFYDSLNIFPSFQMDKKDVNNCGEITVPTSESAYSRFISDIDENEVVICLGEAVANDCETAYAEYDITEDIQSSVYVAKREDGVCSVAQYYGHTHINFCSLVSVMESMTGVSNNFDTWQKEFATDPGETFSQLFTEQEGSPASFGKDCILHEIK